MAAQTARVAGKVFWLCAQEERETHFGEHTAVSVLGAYQSQAALA